MSIANADSQHDRLIGNYGKVAFRHAISSMTAPGGADRHKTLRSEGSRRLQTPRPFLLGLSTLRYAAAAIEVPPGSAKFGQGKSPRIDLDQSGLTVNDKQ
jgi:hypothetical protein